MLLALGLHPVSHLLGDTRVELEHVPRLCFAVERHAAILSTRHREVKILDDFDSCFFKQLSTIPKAVRLAEPDFADARVDDRLRAGKTRLVGAVEFGTLESHTPASCEGDGVLLGVNCSSARSNCGTPFLVAFPQPSSLSYKSAFAWVLTVRQPCRRSVVALHEDAAVSRDYATDMESTACRSCGPDVCRLHESMLAAWAVHSWSNR
jgi:hypothetical protein